MQVTPEQVQELTMLHKDPTKLIRAMDRFFQDRSVSLALWHELLRQSALVTPSFGDGLSVHSPMSIQARHVLSSRCCQWEIERDALMHACIDTATYSGLDKIAINKIFKTEGVNLEQAIQQGQVQLAMEIIYSSHKDNSLVHALRALTPIAVQGYLGSGGHNLIRLAYAAEATRRLSCELSALLVATAGGYVVEERNNRFFSTLYENLKTYANRGTGDPDAILKGEVICLKCIGSEKTIGLNLQKGINAISSYEDSVINFVQWAQTVPLHTIFDVLSIHASRLLLERKPDNAFSLIHAFTGIQAARGLVPFMSHDLLTELVFQMAMWIKGYYVTFADYAAEQDPLDDFSSKLIRYAMPTQANSGTLEAMLRDKDPEAPLLVYRLYQHGEPVSELKRTIGQVMCVNNKDHTAKYGYSQFEQFDLSGHPDRILHLCAAAKEAIYY